jgi:integrase
MSTRLSDEIVRKAPLPEAGARITYDDAVAGFGLRVTAAGARSFIFNYRTHGDVDRRLTIGSAGRWTEGGRWEENTWTPTGRWQEGAWTTAKAREHARALRRKVDQGGDPMGDLHEQRGAPTLAELFDLYTEEVDKSPSTRTEDKSMFEQWLRPEFGTRKVATINVEEIKSLFRKISKSTPTRANRCIALASSLFTFAIGKKLRSDNPARRDKRGNNGIQLNPENQIKRYLSQQELARLTRALAAHENRDAVNVIRLLMLTGSRRGEVLGMEWSQIDFDRAEWIKPRTLTKSREEHRIPLAPAALKLLTEMRERADQGDKEAARIERAAERQSHTKRKQIILNAAARARVRKRSPYVFPSDRNEGEPLMSIRETWKDVCKAAKLSRVRLHDLRHSFASFLVTGGASLQLVGELLGHQQSKTTERYAHIHDNALRLGAERIGEIVAAAEKGELAEVVPFAKRGRDESRRTR